MFENSEEKNKQEATLPYNAYEYKRVQNGRGVYAWIEHSGVFYSGDIPGISGVMKVYMAETFDDCLTQLKDNLKRSTSLAFRNFRQRETLQEIIRKHPNAEIIFIPLG